MVVIHCKGHIPNTSKLGVYQYIGRPGSFGNPFSIDKHGTRDEVIATYEAWARKQPALLEKIKALPEDAVLGCWCAPLPCHGDVIVKLWKEMRG